MKNKKIFIIFLVVVVIINILILVLLMTKKRESVNPDKIVSPVSSEYIQAKSLNIKNSANLSSMDIGDISETDMLNYAKNYVTKLLPDLYAQINNNVDFSKDYFARKKSAIYKYSHIYQYKDFMELINTMKKSDIDFDEYRTIEVLSCVTNDEGTIINCELTYSGDKTINLQIKYVNNKVSETKLKN